MGIVLPKKSRTPAILLLSLLYFALGSSYWPVSATDGDLDLTFGNGGQVTNQLSGDVVISAGVAIQQDGKIMTAATVADNFDNVIVVARNNPDGSLDAGFGSGGTVTTTITGKDFARAIAIQPDGKLLVAGDTSTNFDNPSFLLLRYSTDGSLDSGFGSGGKVITRVGRINDSARAVVLQPDGKILAAGYSAGGPMNISSNHSDFALVRYNTDGSLDPGFGNGGIVTTQFSGAMFQGSDLDIVDALAIQIDGKILAAGEVPNPQSIDAVLVRYNPDGSIDTTFGNSGRVVSRTGSLNLPKGIVVQPDLRILLGGQSWSVSPEVPRFLLARYDTEGGLDASFGQGGNVILTGFALPGDVVGDRAFGLALQADGKIVEAGSAGFPLNRFALARFSRDGSLDASFGSGGIATTDILGHSGTATAVAIQKDGKILAAGQVQVTENQNALALARFESSSEVAIDFSILPDQPQVAVTRGTKVPITINISRNGGFQGTVRIAPPDTTGTGIKVKPAAPIATNGNSVTYKLKITGSASTGTIILTFTGADSSGSVSTATIRVVVH